MKEKKPFHCPKEYKLWKQEEIEELKSIGYFFIDIWIKNGI